MNAITTQENNAVENTTFKVDPHKGQRIGTVSSQWFNRPDDQKFLSLAALEEAVTTRSINARQDIVDVSSIRMNANPESPDNLMVEFNGGQVANQIGRAHV